MMLLTIDETLMLHNKLIAATSGSPGLHDRGLLESAVYGVDSNFEDVERYLSVEEKAARLLFPLRAARWKAASGTMYLLHLVSRERRLSSRSVFP